jgi:hypothetical protein
MPSVPHIETPLNWAVAELREIAKRPGKLTASDLDGLRQGYPSLNGLENDYLYESLVDAVNQMPSVDAAHARLLLRLDHYDKNLSDRRVVARERYRVPKDGGSRVATEKYVLAQVVHGLTQRAQQVARSGQGYEFEAVRFRYWFEDDNPDELRVDAEFDLLMVRDDVRIFTFGSDPTGGSFYDVQCLSTDIGHRFLRQVPIRATAPKAEHYAFFYLGGNMRAGTRTTIALREFWNNSEHLSLAEHGAVPASGGGPLSVTLDAPRTVISHYAPFSEPYERTRRPPQQELIERVDDEPITTGSDTPDRGYIYGFWYKIAGTSK